MNKCKNFFQDNTFSFLEKRLLKLTPRISETSGKNRNTSQYKGGIDHIN